MHKNTSNTDRGAPAKLKFMAGAPLYSTPRQETAKDTDHAADKKESYRKQEQGLSNNDTSHISNRIQDRSCNSAKLSQERRHSGGSFCQKTTFQKSYPSCGRAAAQKYRSRHR